MGLFELAIIVLYCLPAMLAYFMRHPQWRLLAVCNVLFAWTGVGWLAALAAALNPTSFDFIKKLQLQARVPETTRPLASNDLKTTLEALLVSKCDFVQQSAQSSLQQLRNLTLCVNSIHEVLQRKLNQGELAYQRHASGVNQAEQVTRQHLWLVVDLLKNAELHKTQNIEKQVETLKNDSIPDNQQPELPRLESIAHTARIHRERIHEILAHNEAALDILRTLNASWAEVRIVRGQIPQSLEAAIADLKHLDSMVDAYQNNATKEKNRGAKDRIPS